MFGNKKEKELLELIASQLELMNIRLENIFLRIPESFEFNEDKIIAGLITTIQMQKEIKKQSDPDEAMQNIVDDLKKNKNAKKEKKNLNMGIK